MKGSGNNTQRIRATESFPAPATQPQHEALPDGMTVTLEVTAGEQRGQTFHVGRRLVVIGREEGDVRVNDPLISRRHASLEIHDLETIILRDLSSTNGTYHNGKLIAFSRVADADEIRMGSTTLTVSVEIVG